MKKLLLIIISITALFAGCKKEEGDKLPKIETTSLSFMAGESQKIVLTPNSDGCYFSIVGDNHIAASVTSSSGVVSAKRIGECSVSVTKNGTHIGIVKVSVRPKHHMYEEPYFTFNSSKAFVKSYESRKLVTENETSILYEGENSKITNMIYSFKSNNYTASAALVPYSTPNTDLLVAFLTERYIVDSSTGDIVFLNRALKVAGVITTTKINAKIHYMITYFEYQSTQSIQSYIPRDIAKSIDYQIIEELKDAIRNTEN